MVEGEEVWICEVMGDRDTKNVPVFFIRVLNNPLEMVDSIISHPQCPKMKKN